MLSYSVLDIMKKECRLAHKDSLNFDIRFINTDLIILSISWIQKHIKTSVSTIDYIEYQVFIKSANCNDKGSRWYIHVIKYNLMIYLSWVTYSLSRGDVSSDITHRVQPSEIPSCGPSTR